MKVCRRKFMYFADQRGLLALIKFPLCSCESSHSHWLMILPDSINIGLSVVYYVSEDLHVLDNLYPCKDITLRYVKYSFFDTLA